MEYNAIYKCRLCGKEFTDATTSSKDVAISNMVHLVCGSSIKQNANIPVEIFTIHYCGSECYGLADFQGFKSV